MLIVFAGTIGRSGVGGLAWENMHYLIGLRELGHEVVYLEDCGDESWVYHWDEGGLTTDLDYPADYVRCCLEPLGMDGKWTYRAGDRSAGLSIEELEEVCSRADLLITWADALQVWREEYDRPKRRAFIDVDPGFTQFRLVQDGGHLTGIVDRCERLFTVGPAVGQAGSRIPTAGREWHHIWAPIALSHWPIAEGGPATHFTCAMKWREEGAIYGSGDVEFEGQVYGQKDREFPKFIELPKLVNQAFLMAQLGADPDELRGHGWEVVPGEIPTKTPWTFRDFVQASRAEFEVAKHGYVHSKGGWFSCRSVCYMASGRPVLVQDTGVREYLPTGEGIVTFTDPDEAVRGIDAINADYELHRRRARELAEEYFSSVKVLPRLLEIATG